MFDFVLEEKKIFEEISRYILYKNIKKGEGGAIEVFYEVEKGIKIDFELKIWK